MTLEERITELEVENAALREQVTVLADHVHLLLLPPYSPELQPAERRLYADQFCLDGPPFRHH